MLESTLCHNECNGLVSSTIVLLRYTALHIPGRPEAEARVAVVELGQGKRWFRRRKLGLRWRKQQQLGTPLVEFGNVYL